MNHTANWWANIFQMTMTGTRIVMMVVLAVPLGILVGLVFAICDLLRIPIQEI